MSKVTMSQSFVVTNPEGWSYSIRPDDDNSDYIRIEQSTKRDGTGGDYFVFTKEEASFIASALNKFVVQGTNK